MMNPHAILTRTLFKPFFTPLVLLAGLLCPSPIHGASPISLFKTTQKDFGFTFNDGREFPGAKGGLQTIQQDGTPPTLVLSGDFTGGGNYVSTGVDFEPIKANGFSFRFKQPLTDTLTVRAIDTGGVCHQIKFNVKKTDGWQTVTFPIYEFFEKMGTPDNLTFVKKYEKWGGKKGREQTYSGALKSIHFLIGKHSFGDSKKGTIELQDVRVMPKARKQAASYAYTFEGKDGLSGWTLEGKSAASTTSPKQGKHSLTLTRSLEQLTTRTVAISPSMPAEPGKWRVTGAHRADIHSPDSSYMGQLSLAFFNERGKRVGKVSLQDTTKQTEWTGIRKDVEIPPGVTEAKFVAEMKKTYGTYQLDELSLKFIAASNAGKLRIQKLMITAPVVGNMFFPDQDVAVDVVVEAKSPLPPAQQRVEYVLKDYWGAEQGRIAVATLKLESEKKGIKTYRAPLHLSKHFKIDMGRFYEVHVSVPKSIGGHHRDYSGITRLPIAPSKQYKPEQIPWTIRNWDNRVSAYFDQTDRIGIRIAGTWGRVGKGKHGPSHPGLDKIKTYDMGFSTGSPGSDIERKGWKGSGWNPETLGKAMKEWLNKYHMTDRYYQICLGNEPHGKRPKVKENVEAYKVLYETIKAHDPNIVVMGTSVNANEDYFKEGFHKYLDAYDYHVYETYDGVRKTLRRYREMAQKYNADKPIHSTELGLNAQGLPRLLIAGELFKKTFSFFAEGGATVSWFTMNYPDPKGKSRGTNGNAFCVFDCKYNQYNVRIDGIAYYNAVNTLLDKKFAEERLHDGKIHNMLFKNAKGECLQVLWHRTGREDKFVPMPGVGKVRLTHVDGNTVDLDAKGTGLDLTLSQEPVLLTYTHAEAKLVDTLEAPKLVLTSVPSLVVKGTHATITLEGINEDLSVLGPADWAIKNTRTGSTTTLTVSIPDYTTAREGRLWARHSSGDVSIRLALTSPVALAVSPVRDTNNQEAISFTVTNHSSAVQKATIQAEMLGESPMDNGRYAINAPSTTTVAFGNTPPKQTTLQPKSSQTYTLPLKGVDPLNLYTARIAVTDNQGNRLESERWYGGFTNVKKSKGTITIDGKLDESGWKVANSRLSNQARQYYSLKKKGQDAVLWKGPEDLSYVTKWLWDDNHLYLGVEVTDDVFSAGQTINKLWFQDGIQLLIDPTRPLKEKPGRYDLTIGMSDKGPAANYHLTVEKYWQSGPAKDIKVAIVPPAKAGDKTVYEIAIPWANIAPFKPGIGKHFGLTVIMNEDDGNTRQSFMCDFSGAHSKQVGQVGDYMLVE